MKSRRQKSLYTAVEEPAPVTVYLPYTKVTDRLQLVVDCLRIQQVQVTPVKVGDGDEYWQLVDDAWSAGDTFYIVEQDVVVWQGAIQQLDACDQKWCTLPTMCHGRMIPTTFGCVKFSKTLIEQNPGFWHDIETTWSHLDANFSDKMGWPWIRPHDHWPPATHLNEVQWSDAISKRYTLERKMVWQSHEEGQAVARVQFRTTGDEHIPWWRRRRGTHYGEAEIEEIRELPPK